MLLPGAADLALALGGWDFQRPGVEMQRKPLTRGVDVERCREFIPHREVDEGLIGHDATFAAIAATTRAMVTVMLDLLSA
jgi:hypothetical protein